MSWTQVASGRYRRQAGENELFLKFIGDGVHRLGREQWSVSTTAVFKASPHISLVDGWNPILRQAWQLLRYLHPSIASTATDTGHIEYAVPDTRELLSQWLDTTFFVLAADDIDADDVIAGFGPNPSATLHFLPAESRVILHTAHWRTDGPGALQLLDAFFSNVASIINGSSTLQLAWGEEVARLVPSVETALRLPDTAPPELVAAAKRYLASAASLAGTVGVPVLGEPSTLPGGTRRVQQELSEHATTALKSACNKHGLKLISAVHAAVATVTYAKAAPENKEKPYASTIRLSLRPCLPAPYNTAAVAAGLYTGGYTVQVHSNQTLLERAQEYDRHYRRGVTEEFLGSRREYARLGLGVLRGGARPSPVSNIDVSFVEGVDDMVTSEYTLQNTGQVCLEVCELGLGVETVTRQPLCFAWEFCGRLTVSLWYNEAYHNHETAEGILVELKEVLHEL
ncbi:hypothetical protein DL546_008289 [Coniochaeta pulveracea]|uniref:Condensation domain-containing protein n=1 Tax=Coniochaeta pulveracea TaxID=177199 RepID=A0A420YEX9_9PEZI|nr:hypothetical protein DL546_008289 [Coniochaeta pulveracea]